MPRTTRKVETLEKQLSMPESEINQKYQEELDKQGLTQKAEKKPKQPRGAKGKENLSKYRQQVKEALELKKKLETKKDIIELEPDSESDSEVEVVSTKPKSNVSMNVASVPAPQQPTPTFDVSSIMNEINNLKKQNQDLENRFTYRSNVSYANDLRRNMLIKF